MKQESVLATAQFDPKVKQYWLLTWLFVCCVTLFGIVLLPVVGVVVWVVSGKMLDAMSATLSEKKLVVKRGILVKVEKSIPLDKITDVALTQGPIMRLFNLQRLSFETAGQSGTGALVSLLGVIDAQQFREQILTQKERLAEKQQKTASSEPSSVPEQELLQRLVNAVERIEQRLAEKEKRDS
ncbi:PH domain-containing protein [Pseudoalteromonas sp. SSDWG2]|uniref:PH domain-containing protein n=1 Tax=Pseudoalteromonas sp. SSDWG2 TaxID=3139391 RepID=UPI003BA8FAB7